MRAESKTSAIPPLVRPSERNMHQLEFNTHHVNRPLTRVRLLKRPATQKRIRSVVTLHSESGLRLVLSVLVPGPAAVGPGVLGEDLLDQQREAVLLSQEVEVL